MKHFQLLLAAFFLCCFSAVSATPTDGVDVSKLTGSYVSLSSNLEVLKDPTQKWGLTDVQRPDIAAQFQKVSDPDEAVNLGFSNSAVWLRMRLTNTGATVQEKMLDINYSRISFLELHQSMPDASFASTYTGASFPLSTRAHPYRKFVFPIVIQPGAEKWLYVRMLTEQPLRASVRLWYPSSFSTYERTDFALQMLYFGMALAMLMFNIMLFVALREPIYLMYVAFVSTMTFMIASQNGLAKLYLWPGNSPWDGIFTSIGYALAAMALVNFMRMMLNTHQVLPVWDKILRVCVVLFGLLVVGFAVLGSALVGLSAAMYSCISIIVVLVSLHGIYLKQRSAYFFMAAFMMLMVGALSASLAALGVLPVNPWTDNALQMGSALEMVLLAFALADRYNQLRLEKSRIHAKALRSENDVLLAQARTEQAQAQADAQQAHNETLQLQSEMAQAQLVQSEKMASLGQLVASVTHEINTPIGAIKSSGGSITDALQDTIQQLPPLLQRLDSATSHLLVDLLHQANLPKTPMSSREERAIVKKVTEHLEAVGLEQPRQKAVLLVGFNVQTDLEKYLPLLQHAESEAILAAAHNLFIVVGSARNVNVAVDRVAKIVLALKSYSHFNQSQQKETASLVDGLETVLTIYQGQTKVGVTVERNYEYLPPLPCFADELNQVWTNLIHNALQAMNFAGTLTITVRQEGNCALVSVGDTGCGIPEDIRNKIFNVFFTTKPAGVGSGLGLDIVKKIIEKHNGRIDLQSEVGVGTTFSVYLPYPPETIIPLTPQS